MLLARKHNTIPARVREFPSAHGEMASYLQPGHNKSREATIDQVRDILSEPGSNKNTAFGARVRTSKRKRGLFGYMRAEIKGIFYR